MKIRNGSGSSRGLPPLTREALALKLRQNWLAKHPIDSPAPGALDDSLTSLNWLQNLNIMKITTGNTPSVHGSTVLNLDHPKASTVQFSSKTQVNPNAVLNMTNLPIIKQEPGIRVLSVSPPCPRTPVGSMMDISPPFSGLDKIDYKCNPHVKPPYSYATLICMAMRETNKNKITLAGIYNWITENFMYYRVADPSWQNSIRHNLSLNKCFQKVPRRKDEPGKGGFWRINPEYEDMFVNGIFKKRRCGPLTPRECPVAPPPLKRIKREVEDENSNSSIASLSGLATVGAIPAILTPVGSMEDSPLALASIDHYRNAYSSRNNKVTIVSTGSELDAMDFSWSAILNQDIEVGGVRVKTEDIIDDDSDPIASPITALSPPPSDNSSDISLEDLLNTEFVPSMEQPMDLTNGDPLDLTVTGTCVKAPNWWEESLNGKQSFISADAESRLSTPVAPIADSDLDFAHPWAEDKDDSDHGVDSFEKDFTNLFDMLGNVPSPQMSVES